jgi:hypothetical protein
MASLVVRRAHNPVFILATAIPFIPDATSEKSWAVSHCAFTYNCNWLPVIGPQRNHFATPSGGSNLIAYFFEDLVGHNDLGNWLSFFMTKK